MPRLPVPGVVGLFAASAALAAVVLQAPSSAPLPRLDLPPGCEPTAPIRLELEAPDRASGSLALRYTATPLVDVRDLRVEVRLPDGGVLASHAPPPGVAVSAREARAGSAVVEAPDGPGFRVDVVVRARVQDPTVPGGESSIARVESVVYGEPPAPAFPHRVVVTDGLRTRDVAASHRPGGGR